MSKTLPAGTGVLVVCGLNQEAAIAAGPGVTAISGGGDVSGLAKRLDAVDRRRIRAVISFGLAGALDPSLAVGDLIVPDEIVGRNGMSWPIADAIGSRLAEAVGVREARRGRLVGVDAAVLTSDAKRMLARETGAEAIDMESHVAAAFASACGKPFGALRVVSDGLDYDLPALAGSAMRPDGSIDVMSVVRGLARDPRQLPPLLRTARDAGRAMRRLRRVRGLLGPRFGLHL